MNQRLKLSNHLRIFKAHFILAFPNFFRPPQKPSHCCTFRTFNYSTLSQGFQLSFSISHLKENWNPEVLCYNMASDCPLIIAFPWTAQQPGFCYNSLLCDFVYNWLIGIYNLYHTKEHTNHGKGKRKYLEQKNCLEPNILKIQHNRYNWHTKCKESIAN